MIGLISCSPDSKLSKEEQKNNSNIKEVLDNVKKDVFKNLYGNQQEQKDFTENFEDQKHENSIVPVEYEASARVQKKEIKQENLIPVTDDEKEADKVIKNTENILKNSGFSKLIKDICMLKDEYISIKNDFDDVISNIKNRKTSLMSNYKDNKDKINKLTQLQNTSKTYNDEFDKFINKIDIVEQEIRSAAFFFDRAQKNLKDSIIKRLESKKKNSDASQLSRQALIDAENALKNLESYFSQKVYAMVKMTEIQEFIKHLKTILARASINR